MPPNRNCRPDVGEMLLTRLTWKCFIIWPVLDIYPPTGTSAFILKIKQIHSMISADSFSLICSVKCGLKLANLAPLHPHRDPLVAMVQPSHFQLNKRAAVIKHTRTFS